MEERVNVFGRTVEDLFDPEGKILFINRQPPCHKNVKKSPIIVYILLPNLLSIMHGITNLIEI